jgi:hypothetical protein
MVQAQEDPLTEIEGPKGVAQIFEVTLSATKFEIAYKVVFNGQENSFPSLGEAHLFANEQVGLATSD